MAPPGPFAISRRAVGLSLAGILALAALARGWQLTGLPPGLWYDEAHKGIVALAIAHGESAPLYVTDNQGLEAGFFWLLAGWFKLFGPSYFASRALTAGLGTLTVLAVFLALRGLYREHPGADWAALLAAALLAVLLWHVHWSRLGMETIMVPLGAAVLLGLLAWAWARGRAWAFALAGFVLGLSQYTNPGARLLPLEALAVFALLRRGTWPQTLRFGLAFLAAALLAYAPLGWFFLHNPEWFLNRVAFTSANARAGGLAFVLDSAWKTLLSLNFRGDVMVRHNLALQPALDPIASLWMAAGLLAMARERAAWRAHLALLAALAINLLPMVFSDGAPGFGRTLGAAPFVAALPALGLRAALGWPRARAWARWAVLASLAGSAALNLGEYFLRYPQQPGLFAAFEVGLWTLDQATARGAAAGPAYLILGDADLAHPTTRLTTALTAGDLRLVNAQGCLAFPARTEAPTVLGMMPGTLPRLRAEFPAAPVTEILNQPEPYVFAALLTVPAGQASVSGQAPALAQVGEAFDLLGVVAPTEAVPAGAAVPLTLRWRARAAGGPVNYTTFVHLLSDQRPFLAGADGEPCQGRYPTSRWHAGEVIEWPVTLTLPADLAAGRYDLAVGMYELASGQRLPVTQAAQREPDRALAAVLTVR